MATLKGDNGKNFLEGTADDDRIFGYGDNDLLKGNQGDDVLVGGAGNDKLSGGPGADTYVFSQGDGKDIISDSGNANSVDIIQFVGVKSTAIDQIKRGEYQKPLFEHTNTLYLSFGNDLIVIHGYFNERNSNGRNSRIEQFQFSDGVVWAWEDIKQKVLAGTLGDDHLIGYNEQNSISGQDGDDVIRGGNLGDILNGGSGNDIIFGDYSSPGGGDDTLIGGTGDDFLRGDGGVDTYLFARGDGNDSIEPDHFEDGQDMVVKFKDVSSTELRVSRDFNNLFLSYGDTDRITIDSYFYDGHSFHASPTDQIQFSDGIIWTPNDIINELARARPTQGDDWLFAYDGIINQLSGLAGDDSLLGSSGDDLLVGGAGNDSLFGYKGADVLIGDPGNDLLLGGSGNDTYVFRLGNGFDSIEEEGESGIDIIRFAHIRSDQLSSVSRQDNHLVLQINDHDRIKVVKYFSSNAHRIEEFRFADGVTWTPDDFKDKVLQATEGDDWLIGLDDERQYTLAGLGGNDVIGGGNLDDRLYGNDGDDLIRGGFRGNDRLFGGRGDDTISDDIGNDLLIGGAGNDHLYGGSGNDTYVFTKGDGQDFINNSPGVQSESDPFFDDVVKFTNVASTEVTISRSVDDLILSYGNGDSITVSSHFFFYHPFRYRVGQYQFSDGVVWTSEDINKKSLQGTAGDDTLIALYGKNNKIHGLLGDDRIFGDNGNVRLYGDAGNDYLVGYREDSGDVHLSGNDYLKGGEGEDLLIGGFRKDLLDLAEARPQTDTVRINYAESLANSFDIITAFALGDGIGNTGVDRLDLESTRIAADTSAKNGVNAGIARSHAISNGIISFSENDQYSGAMEISADNLNDIFVYLQKNIGQTETVAFNVSGNTYVFQDAQDIYDVVVQLAGIVATNLNNDGLVVDGIWLV